MDDAERLTNLATELADGVETHLAGWMVGSVTERLGAAITAAESVELETAAADISASVRELLALDIDQQAANPLALLRSAVGPMTNVLRRHGAPPTPRDADAVRLHPDDVYDLTPAGFADIHPDLHLPGLSWGAAKAHVHLSRRRAEGLR